jgi:Concanavalin A-like lectin/glucanases superfamily
VLRIGGNAIWGEYFSGLIDEVRIYNRARTQAQIQSDMNTPIGSPEHLLGEEIAAPDATPFTEKEIRPLFHEAVSRWATVIGMPEAAQRLLKVDVQVLDLPGTLLGIASTTIIFLDAKGAGHGWFIDPTPRDDSEFAPSVVDSPAADHVDLLTVIVHEMGHLLGLDDDSDADPFTGSVMADTLPLGVRRINLDGPRPESPAVPQPSNVAAFLLLSAGSDLRIDTGVASQVNLASAAMSALAAVSTQTVDSEPTAMAPEAESPLVAGPPNLVARKNVGREEQDLSQLDLVFADLDRLWDDMK